MIDRVGEIAWSMRLMLGIVVLGATLWDARHLRLRYRVPAAFSFGGAAYLFCFLVGWSVALRDGLGPDAVRSAGTVAVERALEGWWLALLYLAVPLVLGVWCIRRGRLFARRHGVEPDALAPRTS